MKCWVETLESVLGEAEQCVCVCVRWGGGGGGVFVPAATVTSWSSVLICSLFCWKSSGQRDVFTAATGG